MPDRRTLDQLRIDRSAAPSGRWAGILVGALLILGIVVLLIWWLGQPGPTVVRTAAARQESTGAGGERTLLNASGYVTARRAATVSSKITGKVVEVLVEEGMKVEANQVVAHLDAANAEKSLKLAEAQLESSKRALGEVQANLDRAESELRRTTAAADAVSASELERVQTDVKALQARLERQKADVIVAEGQLSLARQQLDDTIIRAPFAGIVTTKDSQPGEMISPVSAGGGYTRTGICTIVDMTSLEVEVDVSESYINRVERGRPVIATLDSYPDWQIPAKVIAIIPTADRQKATVKVRVGFDKLDPRILPDMSVKVAFQGAGPTTAASAGVVVPKPAVRQSDGRDIVWVARDGRVERRAVTVGRASGDDVLIAAGVSAGERVVIEGADGLVDGARVKESER